MKEMIRMKTKAVLGIALCACAGLVNGELVLEGDTWVKTGAETLSVDASHLGGRSLRVDSGTLRVKQSAETTARYIRFRVHGVNPWRTENASEGWVQMDSFQLVKNGAIVDYPTGTTVENVKGNSKKDHPPSNVLTFDFDGSEAGDWQIESDDPGFVIDMKQPVSFTGYALSGATISPGRSPYAFTVEVGIDNAAGGIDWFLFDLKTQFCTCDWGQDAFGAGNGYAPRMPPVYAANPIDVFSAQSTVAVSAGAVLELDGVAGRLPNLTGAGTVILKSSCPELTGNCSFTGVFDGAGLLTFAMNETEVSAFSFATTAIEIGNAGKERTFTVSGGGTPAKLPLVFDSGLFPLNLVLSGAVETPKLPLYRDRFGNEIPFNRFGKTISQGAEVRYLDSAPVIARYVRFTPISGLGTETSQTADFKMFLGGERVAADDLLSVEIDAYKTAAYRNGTLSGYDASLFNGKKEGAEKMFDADPATYYQFNRDGSAELTLNGTPALTVLFASAKAFDAYELQQPTYDVAGNPDYWIAQWRIETSRDGNMWEVISDQSQERVSKDKLYTGWPPVVNGPVASGSPLRTGEWLKTDVEELQEDCVLAGELKYIRLLIRELAKANGETNGSTYIDIGEFELLRNGAKVFWPTGTTVSGTEGFNGDASGLINAPVQLPNTQGNYNDAAENEAADGGGNAENAKRAIWEVPTYAELCRGAGFVMTMQTLPLFDSYTIYAGDNWNDNHRCLSKWTVDVSYDGVSWTTIDAADREKGFSILSVWLKFQRFVTRSVDFSSVGRYAADRFSDDGEVIVPAGLTLSVSNATETVGTLSGTGRVSLQDAQLTVANGASVFSGSIGGAGGVLVVDGGTFTADKADFRTLSRIVLKNGAVLSGSARYKNTLVIEAEDGCVNSLTPNGFFVMSIR